MMNRLLFAAALGLCLFGASYAQDRSVGSDKARAESKREREALDKVFDAKDRETQAKAEAEKDVKAGRDDIHTFDRVTKAEQATDKAIREYNNEHFYKDVVEGGNHLREREPREH